jgi:hypothetical protein
MPYSDHTTETIATRGKMIYQRLRDEVEPHHNGKFLAIDIETEDYEIDVNGTVAVTRLFAKHSDAAIYLLRIGHQAAYRMGFRGTYGTLTNKVKANTKPLQ